MLSRANKDGLIFLLASVWCLPGVVLELSTSSKLRGLVDRAPRGLRLRSRPTAWGAEP